MNTTSVYDFPSNSCVKLGLSALKIKQFQYLDTDYINKEVRTKSELNQVCNNYKNKKDISLITFVFCNLKFHIKTILAIKFR